MATLEHEKVAVVVGLDTALVPQVVAELVAVFELALVDDISVAVTMLIVVVYLLVPGELGVAVGSLVKHVQLPVVFEHVVIAYLMP